MKFGVHMDYGQEATSLNFGILPFGPGGVIVRVTESQ